MKKLIKWLKENPILHIICIIDVTIALLAIMSGAAVIWNLAVLWDTSSIMISPNIFLGELWSFGICSGIWLILSLIPGVRKFRKSI